MKLVFEISVIIITYTATVIDTMVEAWVTGRIRTPKSFPSEACWRIPTGMDGVEPFVRENSIETEAGTVLCLILSPRT